MTARGFDIDDLARGGRLVSNPALLTGQVALHEGAEKVFDTHAATSMRALLLAAHAPNEKPLWLPENRKLIP